VSNEHSPAAPRWPACLQTLKCGVVLVVGDERLYSQLSSELKRQNSGIEVRSLLHCRVLLRLLCACCAPAVRL